MILERIDYITSNYKRIGIFISGGFDSALLLYLIKLYQKNNEIFLFTVDRYNFSIKYSTAVCDWINKKFDDNLKITLVGNSKLPPHYQVRSGFNESLSYGPEVLLIGDTTNPAEVPGGYKRILSNNPKIQQPFFEYSKDTLVKIAKDFGVLELLSVTRSCGDNRDPECGVCWNCQEKNWAMNKVL